MTDRLRRLLIHPRLPWGLAVLAVVLSLPALGAGLQLDDHYLRFALSRPAIDPAWARSPLDVFSFFRGDPEFVRQARDSGALPWWAADDLQLAFFRPLSGLTHWLDFRLWPAHPALMHAQSLAWLAAVVGAAALLYRRLPLPPAVAGLAALVFALDDAHGTPATWIANRNALVASLFALLALAAHDRWRREGWRPGAVLAPVLLLLGLFGGETAVAAGGYLLGYALFLDRAPWRTRLLSLAPCTTVGVAWTLGYRALGYGARGSILYVDPGHPAEFLPALLERAPILFFGEWALPSEFHGLLSPGAQRTMWVASCVLAALVATLLWPLLRRDAVARFFATGMLLALVPPSATFPNNRLLVLSGFGGAGLLAQWFVSVRRDRSRPPDAWRERVARVVFWPAVFVHLVISPLLLPGNAANLRLLGDVATRGAQSLPTDAAFRSQQAFVVNTPTAFLTSESVLIRILAGGPMASRFVVLGSGLGATRVSRVDAQTLAIRVDGGFLAPAGIVGERRAFRLDYMFALFDRLYRGAGGFRPGENVHLSGLDIEIESVTADGRPDEVRFHFDRPLDDPGYRWLRWKDDGYPAFELPPVGRSVELPPVTVSGF